jgi:hypothetical protein
MQEYILNDHSRRKVKSSRGTGMRGKIRKEEDIIGMTIKQWHNETAAKSRAKTTIPKEEVNLRKELRVGTSGDNINLFWAAEEKKQVANPSKRR